MNHRTTRVPNKIFLPSRVNSHDFIRFQTTASPARRCATDDRTAAASPATSRTPKETRPPVPNRVADRANATATVPARRADAGTTTRTRSRALTECRPLLCRRSRHLRPASRRCHLRDQPCRRPIIRWLRRCQLACPSRRPPPSRP